MVHDDAPPSALARLARAPRLALLVDLDGTLIPFAATAAEASLDDGVARTLRALDEVGVQVVVISGRPRELVDPVRALVPRAWWFAEHGAWRHDDRGWSGPPDPDGELASLAARLATFVRSIPGARLERKTLSCALHWREVAGADRGALGVAELAIDEWLETHPDHERLDGVQLVEIRARDCHKGRAVAWVQARLAGTPLVALGDDVTDEDMFRALTEDDLGVAVGRPDRPSRARAFVDGVAGAHRLVAWLAEVRALGTDAPPPIEVLDGGRTPRPRTSFLVIANRTPAASTASRHREVGGLVAALEPALVARDGVWLGWSGADGADEPAVVVDTAARPTRACFDFPPAWRQRFYGGLCNRALWPLLHGFPSRICYRDEDWASYVDANATYGRLASELAAPDAAVWVHDYHLFLAGAELRRRGHRGPLGFFLHVPFPCADVLETLPWAKAVLAGLLAFDLIGVHTSRYVDNLLGCMRAVLGVRTGDGCIHVGNRVVRVEAFPIGIDPAPFRHDLPHEPSAEVGGLRATLGERKLLLGVDRLDYSKGIPERLTAFERLLERHPRWRRQVSMVQISVPSRADVPEYAELRTTVENLVGRINGRFGDADWVPVRYLYRSYDHGVLAQLYRAADVAVVTPLRDGMNLVAKEVVAAQDPARPAALVLSRFAGAAETLDRAILTNPYHADGLADDLDRALSMPLDERRDRHAHMLAAVHATTSHAWADRFLAALHRAAGAAS